MISTKTYKNHRFLLEAVVKLLNSGHGVRCETSDDFSTATITVHADVVLPNEEDVTDKCFELQSVYEAKQYQRDRAAEYPSVNDYLDGIVKGDQAQIDAYIDACQAVKSKYPKPE